MGAAAIPYVIAAVGAGIGARQQRQMVKRQDRIATQGILNQAKHQREADSRVQQEIDARMKSSPDAARKQATSDFVNQLRRARVGQGGELAGASDRFQSDVADVDNGVMGYGTALADTAARINAPLLQRQQEAQSQGRTASDLSVLGGRISSSAFLNDLRLRNVRANPWVTALAGGLQSAGGAMAGSGFGQGQTGVASGKAIRRVDVPQGGFATGGYA